MSGFDDMSMLELFQMESDELLAELDRLILTLDEQQEETAFLECITGVARIVHTIKGSARTISLQEICDFTHALEDYINQINTQNAIDRDVVDYLLRVSDMLKYIIRLAVIEQPYPTNLEESIVAIKNGEPIEPFFSDAGKIVPDEPIETDSPSRTTYDKKKTEDYPHTATVSTSPIPETTFGTQRVALQSLDSLLNLAGELYVKSTGINQFKNDVRSTLETATRLTKHSTTISLNIGEKNIQPIKYNASIEKLSSFCEGLEQQIGGLFQSIDEINTHFKQLTGDLRDEVMQIRMVPLSRLFDNFPRMVRDLSGSLEKRVQINIKGESTRIDKAVIEVLKAPLEHMIRNAIDHGIESPKQREELRKPSQSLLNLTAFQQGDEVVIRLEDDGKGIDLEEIRSKIINQNRLSLNEAKALMDDELKEFLFLPGFSTRNEVNEYSGRGIGLDIVKTEIEKINGSVTIDSLPGVSTSFSLRLPLNLAVTHTLLLEVCQQVYAFPANLVEEYLQIYPREIQNIGGKQIFNYHGRILAVAWLDTLMGLEGFTRKPDKSYPALLFKMDETMVAIIADRFVGQNEVMVKPLDLRLKKVPNINGASILNDGRIILVVDINGILNSVREIHYASETSQTTENPLTGTLKRILVVEDSLTVREMQRRLLEQAGYDVTLAMDGVDGLSKIKRQVFDIIISDIDMPRMNGLTFTRKIKNNDKYSHIPLIIVSYKDRAEDKEKGLEAGADHYIAKSQFSSDEFLQLIERLI